MSVSCSLWYDEWVMDMKWGSGKEICTAGISLTFGEASPFDERIAIYITYAIKSYDPWKYFGFNPDTIEVPS